MNETVTHLILAPPRQRSDVRVRLHAQVRVHLRLGSVTLDVAPVRGLDALAILGRQALAPQSWNEINSKARALMDKL